MDFYNNPRLLTFSFYHSPLSAALYYLPGDSLTNLGLGSNEMFVVSGA